MLLLGLPGRAALSPFGPVPPVVQPAPPPVAIDPGRQLPWRVFTWRDGVKPGNPQLAQDIQGYVWVDGPVRYNGREWQEVPIPGEPGPQRIWTMLAARDGSLWFGYKQGGLLRLRAGTWTRYAPGRGLPAGFVNALVEAGGGDLWVGTTTGLARCRDGRCAEERALRGVNVRCLAVTRTEGGRPALWIGTNRGLLRLEGIDGTAPALSPGFAEAAALPSLSIRSLLETASPVVRSLWVGTDLGLARLRGGVWTRYDERSGFPRAPITALAAGLSLEGSPAVWVGTFSSGLLRIDEDGRWAHYDTRSGLPSNYVYNLLVTRTGTGGRPTLWVSMPTSVARLERERWNALDSRSGLPDDTVVGVGEATFPDGLHTYWIGTISGMVRQRPDGNWERYSPFSAKPEVVLSAVDTREEDGTPAFWVGTVGGLYRFAHGRWTSRTARSSPPPLLQDWVVSVLATPAERGTALWAGTRSGLARYERGLWTVFQSRSSGLPGDQIWALARTPGNGGGTVLWAGTERGLGRFERERWQTVPVPCLPPAEITAIRPVLDAKGGWLWVGTEGRGVARLRIDGDGHPLGPCETLPGRNLPSPFVVGIEADAQGRIYLFTASGAVRLTLAPGRGLETARSELFNAGDGLPGMEFNRASFVDHLGRVWAGTIGGAAILDPLPPERAAAGPPAPLRLERVLVDGRDHPLPPGTALPYDDDNLEFRYALLSYRREQETRYRTQLAGLEARPSPWTSENRSVYSRLPRGEYRFRVWGRNGDGVVSGPVEVRFRIRPAAWLSAWAIALYAAALVGLGYVASHLRVLARRTASLEAQVAARTRELAEANRRLELASLTDPLTGLSNRRFLSMRIAPGGPGSPERRQPREGLIFCFLDIDHFKQLNDRAGHAGGDEVLIEVADRLRRTVRDTDTVIRWGGEEFLIVSPGTDRTAGAALAERLLLAVAGAPFVTRVGGRFTVTCSIGWAPHPWCPGDPDAIHYEQVMSLADSALYVAKREGRNRALGVLPGPDGSRFPEGPLEAQEGKLVELVRSKDAKDPKDTKDIKDEGLQEPAVPVPEVL
jgi:diguanylate cyclase (GGDEF)-like protein